MDVPQDTSSRTQSRRTANEVLSGSSAYMAAPKPTQPKTAGQTLAMNSGCSACWVGGLLNHAHIERGAPSFLLLLARDEKRTLQKAAKPCLSSGVGASVQ